MADIKECEIAISQENVTVVGNDETAILNSPVIKAPFNTCRAIIIAWGQLKTGNGTTAVIPRIRSRQPGGWIVISRGVSEAIKTSAGSVEPFFIIASEERFNVDALQYALTLQQVNATTDGTCLQAAILVLIL